MPNSDKKARLIEILREEIQIRDDFLAGLDENVRNSPGAPDRWSVKDTIAHAHHWKQMWVDRLADAARGAQIDAEEDVDSINNRYYPIYKDWSWDKVLDRDRAATEALIAEVEKLSQADLDDTERFPTLAGRPVHSGIFGDGFSHPLVHFSQIAIGLGDLDQAIRLNERTAQARQELDDSPYVQAMSNYNLACFYALAGQSQRAIELLARVFPSSPNLLEWSKKDTDLDSLRDLPEFQALYM